MNQKTKQFFVVFVVSLFVAGTFAYKEVYATEEDALLAEFASNVSNILPENILISTAEVEIEEATTRNGITVKTYRKEVVTTSIDMPVIFDNPLEDSGKVALSTEDQAEEDLENWGIPSLTGTKNFLVKNTTDFEATSLAITDNYAVESYYYFLLEGLKSKGDSGAITVTASFATAATVTNTTFWRNETIVNAAVYPLAQTAWFNLLLNANSTHKYVVHITCANIDVTGHYIFQFYNSRYVSDTRHSTIYINTDETVLASVKGVKYAVFGDDYFIGYDACQPTGDDMIILAGTTVDDLNVTKMLAVPAPIQRTNDMRVRYQGWTKISELEDDLKIAFRQKMLNDGLMTANDRIYDYNVTKMHWQMNLNVGLLKLIRKALEKQLQSSTDYRTLVISALSQVLPMATITSIDNLPDELPIEKALDPYGTIHPEAFWSDVGDFFSNIGSGIASTAQKFLDVPLKLIDTCGSLGGKIVQTVGGTAQTAINTVGNTINTVTGHVGTAIGSAVGAVKEVGKSLAEMLKWPLIIGVPVLVVALVVGGYFYIKKR